VPPEIEYDATMLRGWFAIEVLMFMGQIFSNTVFLLTRACSKIRILGTRTSGLAANNANSDMVEEQQVLLSLFSSYIAPLICTFCLFSMGFDAYPDVSNRIWDSMFSLMVFQLIQSIICIYITFMPYRRGEQ